MNVLARSGARAATSPARSIRFASTESLAIVYKDNGDPKEILQAKRYTLAPLQPHEARVRFKLSALNPADFNVIQGTYPSKPRKRDGIIEGEQVYLAGNEALAEVEELGDEAAKGSGLQKGDWVVFGKPQFGTWQTRSNASPSDLIKLPRTPASPLTEIEGATITINPATAYRMLRDFEDVAETKGWMIQNGGNSAVGQAAIQLCREWGVKNIALIRERPDVDTLKSHLKSLGATHVLTYNELADRSTKSKIKEWTGGQDIKLGLNCVGGKDNLNMSKFLGQGAHLVTYGAMSMQPLSLPSSLFIFKDLRSVGFWMTRWYSSASQSERSKMTNELVDLIEYGKLKAPDTEIVEVGGGFGEEESARRVRDAVRKSMEGYGGKKVLLRFLD